MLLQGIFPTQGSNPGHSHCRQILYQLSHKGNPKPNNLIKKGAEDLKRHFFQGRYTDDQKTHEKMLNIVNHQRNANQNHNEVSPYTCQNDCHQGDNMTNVGEDAEKRAFLHCCCWRECKLVQLLWRTVWKFLKSLQIGLPYDLTVLLLGAYPETMKTLVHKVASTPVFTKVKVLVAQPCLILCGSMHCSPPGSSSWGSPGRNTGAGRHSLLQGILRTQRSNPGLLHCRRLLYPLSHQGSPNVHSSIVYLFIKVPSTDEWINV